MPKLSVDTPKARIARLRSSGKKWREIGIEFPDVPLGTLCRIYKDSRYEPKRPDIRAALGLPCYAPAPVCVKCGIVHVTKRCTAKRNTSAAPRRNWKRAWQWAASMLIFINSSR